MESSLISIAVALNNTVLTIVPAVTGTVIPLAVDEVEALITALSDIHSIVSSIETTLMSTISTVKAGELPSQSHSNKSC